MRSREWMRMFAVVTVAGLATACGGDKNQQQTAADTTAAAPAESPSAAPAGSTAAAPAAAAALDTTNLPQGVTGQMVAQGQQIFHGKGNCYTCHGMDGKGTTLAPDMTDQTYLNIDGSYESMVKLVHTGVPQPKQHPAPMPAMGGAQLTDQEVNAVAAYEYTLSHHGQ